MLAQIAPLSRQKFRTSARFFGGSYRQQNSDPAASSVSPTMSAMSFMSDAWARTANGRLVSTADYCSASKAPAHLTSLLFQQPRKFPQ
jgi:hypothetical protein